MRIKPACLFAFLFSLAAFHSTAQHKTARPKADSSVMSYFWFSPDSLNWNQSPIPYDTLPKNEQRYDLLQDKPGLFYAQTGNIGRASNPLFFNPNLKPGFDFGIHTLDPYRLNFNNIPYFQLYYPMSKIKFLMGPKKEILLDLMHNQNIGKHFKMGLEVLALKSPGAYNNQLTNMLDLKAFIAYQTPNKRYRVSLGGIHNFIENDENGGIAADSLFEENLETNRKMIPVNLPAARSTFKENGAFLIQEVDLIRKSKLEKDSSSLKLRSYLPNKLRLASTFAVESWTYDDEGNQMYFYPTVPKDTTYTRDYTLIRGSHTNLFLYHTQNKAFPVNYYGKLSYRNDKVLDSVIDITEQQWHMALGLSMALPLRFVAGIDWDQQLSGEYHSGDQKTVIFLEKRFGEKEKTAKLRLDYTNAAISPSWFQQSYHSNYFNWDNNFGQSFYSIYSLDFSYRGYSLTVKQTEAKQAIVLLPVTAMPSQLDEKLSIREISFRKAFHVWKLVLDNDIRAQKVSNDDVLHLPSWTSRHALYFDLMLFKNALNMQPGFDLYLQSENYGDAYMPALRSFYLQYDKKLPLQSYFDVFVNMKLSRAVIFVSYNHIDGKVKAGEYYTTPGYPTPDAGFRFGINWILRDPPETKTENPEVK
jgi:hypothetical protein